jgi:hypothetical protein
MTINNRREQYLNLVRQANALRFNSEGKWIAPETAPGYRERQWHCFHLLAGDNNHIDLANRIIETSAADNNDFQSFFTSTLLRMHEDKLNLKARTMLLNELRATIDHSEEHLFRYTENCGLLNAFALLEAARRFNVPRYAERARLYLKATAHYHHQHSAGREYFSINYIPVTLAAAASIAHLSADAESQEIAKEIEHHIWKELAMVWHPQVKWSAGPSGRSCTYNSLGLISGLHLSAWLGFGDETCLSPEQAGFFIDAESCGSLKEQLPFHQASAGWYAALPYDVPKEAIQMAHQKSFPYQITSSTEIFPVREHEPSDLPPAEIKKLGGWCSGAKGFIPNQIVSPRGRTHLTCFMQPDYGLGTATRQMCGQSDTIFASWRCASTVTALAHQRTLSSRFVVNDELEQEYLAEGGYRGNLNEQGRGGAAQSGPLGVQWYGGNDVVTHGISRLRTCVIIPEWFKSLDEIKEVGGWVFLRDGEVYVGLHPLGGQETKIEQLGRIRAITFSSYAGPVCDFHPTQLRQIRGGSVVCMGSRDEFSDFEKFCATCHDSIIEDTLYENQRHINLNWNGRKLELIWCMQSEMLLWLRDEHGFVKM